MVIYTLADVPLLIQLMHIFPALTCKLSLKNGIFIQEYSHSISGQNGAVLISSYSVVPRVPVPSVNNWEFNL